MSSTTTTIDNDGRPSRTGTWVTTSAHIITTVIGSGVLLLAWSIAQLGWMVGPATLIGFSLITLFTSFLLTDAYRHPDGRRNYTYLDAVRAHLGGRRVQLCGLAQYPKFKSHRPYHLNIICTHMQNIIGG
ncbi:unnamed protein product [Linum trigynum]|uniref:Amino acid transporter transmembrane domain-containing protein n=1 Tax=Linum trigynum TaxID=586398 RepID=A0AAV2CRX8_9ROSI